VSAAMTDRQTDRQMNNNVISKAPSLFSKLENWAKKNGE
jgi:hypothetical protein